MCILTQFHQQRKKKWKKWKIQFLPICYEQKIFPNQPNFGQRIHYHHGPLTHAKFNQAGKRSSAIVQALGSYTTREGVSHMSEVQPHAELHDRTNPNLKHESTEWDMTPS